MAFGGFGLTLGAGSPNSHHPVAHPQEDPSLDLLGLLEQGSAKFASLPLASSNDEQGGHGVHQVLHKFLAPVGPGCLRGCRKELDLFSFFPFP